MTSQQKSVVIHFIIRDQKASYTSAKMAAQSDRHGLGTSFVVLPQVPPPPPPLAKHKRHRLGVKATPSSSSLSPSLPAPLPTSAEHAAAVASSAAQTPVEILLASDKYTRSTNRAVETRSLLAARTRPRTCVGGGSELCPDGRDVLLYMVDGHRARSSITTPFY